MTGLVGELFDGPIDIVGDVHGEHDALLRLLSLLGYDKSGEHPAGRRLVFLGDLVDRGHDSPAVLEMVIDLFERGRAQCVLGNHELNIVLGRYGHGNGWLLDPPPGVEPETYQSRRADPDRRAPYTEFFQRLPVALEHDGLRVVHACWHEASVAALRSVADADLGDGVSTQYTRADAAAMEEQFRDELLQLALAEERTVFDEDASSDEWEPVPLPAHSLAELDLHHANSLRVSTAGLARPTIVPYFGAGKWRMTERIPWWNTYRDAVPVVIGHFWRGFSSTPSDRYGVFGSDVLAGVRPHDWMGLRRNVYCVDYSVGKRHLFRRHNQANDGKLAAIRYPEWHVVHDDNSVIEIGNPDI